ncbi:MAG: hypothetical protein MZU91_08595 [Desulfosudis oleivorans]|nr:hypothetical protein [Desulfosudis oleivorans]
MVVGALLGWLTVAVLDLSARLRRIETSLRAPAAPATRGPSRSAAGRRRPRSRSHRRSRPRSRNGPRHRPPEPPPHRRRSWKP